MFSLSVHSLRTGLERNLGDGRGNTSGHAQCGVAKFVDAPSLTLSLVISAIDLAS